MLDKTTIQRISLYLHYTYSTDSFISIIKRIAHNITHKEFVTFKKSDFLFFSSVNRKDHKETFNLIFKECRYSKSQIVIKENKCFNLSYLFEMIKHFNLFFKTGHIPIPTKTDGATYDLSVNERLNIFVSLIRYIELSNTLSIMDMDGVKAVVVLADALPKENVLVYVANQLDIKTITAQHALFRPGIINDDMIDILNLWNIPSGYVMTFGKETNALIRKYNSHKNCYICGNIKSERKEYLIMHEYIGIAMDIPYYKDFNQKMIEIVQKYAKKNQKHILIRKHPLDDERNYIIDSSVAKFGNDLDSVEVIVAHTTSMYFTYIVSGKQVFRYSSDILYYELPKDIEFVDYEDFERKYDKIRNYDFKNIIKKQILYIGDESRKQYKLFFNKIFTGEI